MQDGTIVLLWLCGTCFFFGLVAVCWYAGKIGAAMGKGLRDIAINAAEKAKEERQARRRY